MSYYTFRLVSRAPLKIECAKWDDGSTVPESVYVVYPETDSCSCVAMKRECKHVQRAHEITKTPELVAVMFHWRWDERNGWIEMHDIPDIEEFERAMFVHN
jgi:hypothetical protein